MPDVTAITTERTADEWWRGAVIYQVYPRSFADSNGDGVGDLRGLIEHLDHLVGLGVDAVWISPFFRSPMVDNGYDIADHCAVDPVFGTLDDVRELLDQAHCRGLRVLLDAVLAHTSDQHPWFRAASRSRESERRSWYTFRDPAPGGGRPNHWVAGLPKGAPTWTFHESTGQWYLHSHLPQQPDLNWDEPAVEEAMHEVLRFWLELGVDGFRLDAVCRIGKDPDLRENLPGMERQQSWPSVHPRLQRLRQLADHYGAVLVGEVWTLDLPDLVRYLQDGELQLAHNFIFPRLPFSASAWADHVRRFESAVGQVSSRSCASWFLSNHDEPRAASRWDDDGRGVERAELLSMLVLALRGTAFLYQGEELGLRNAQIFADPDGRDVSRAPLAWCPPSQVGAGAGFTDGSPWLPIAPGAEVRNVDSQAQDPASTLSYHRALLRERRSSAALRYGEQELTVFGDVLLIDRSTSGDRRLVLLNTGTKPARIRFAELGVGEANLTCRVTTCRERVPGGEVARDEISLAALEGLVLEVHGADTRGADIRCGGVHRGGFAERDAAE